MEEGRIRTASVKEVCQIRSDRPVKRTSDSLEVQIRYIVVKPTETDSEGVLSPDVREVVQNLILEYPPALRVVERPGLPKAPTSVNGLPEKIIKVGNAAKAQRGLTGRKRLSNTGRIL